MHLSEEQLLEMNSASALHRWEVTVKDNFSAPPMMPTANDRKMYSYL